MTGKPIGEQSRAVQRFWHNYFSILEKSHVSVRARPWYRKHVEGYIQADPERRLADHLPHDVDTYLAAKGRLPNLRDWQFRQIVDALRLLFCELVGAPWARDYDWLHWRAFARTLEADHVTLARDGGGSLPMAPSRNPLVTRFRAYAGADYTAFVTTLRVRGMAIRTEQIYEHWLARFCAFHGWRPLAGLGAAEVAAFLEHLAVRRQVAAATQRIALNALVFLFREVMGRKLDVGESFTHAAAKRRIPVVLTKDEVRGLLGQLRGRSQLMAALMYGTGMRVMECVRLRVMDIDFGFSQITVRSGKGDKDRVVPLPAKLVTDLQSHLAEVRRLHNADLLEGFGEAYLPPALARKYRGAGRDWRWQYAFPAARVAVDPASGMIRRHHAHETGLQKAIRTAARDAGLGKRVTSHTLRHSFATHLLQDGRDIRVIQELLGHADVSTTMIYTHVLQKGGLGVQSPLDNL